MAPQLSNPDVVASVAIALQGKVLSEGPLQPVDIDPATMEDGLYMLTVAAEGKAGNIGLNAARFMVDRVDSFNDVAPTHWSRQYVEVLHHVGVINGRGEGTYAPDQSVTRAEFAKMLALTLGLEASDSFEAPDFADVAPDFWGRPYVEALAERDLIRHDGRDGLDQGVPRWQVLPGQHAEA